MDYSALLSKLIRFSIGLTLVVIVLGAYTRISDAGLGCPDWPGCYGQLNVPMKNDEIMRASALFPGHTIEPYKAWLEMIHRYVAGTLGLLIASILVVSFKVPNIPKVWPSALALLVVFQAALGMWTVTLKLMPIIVVLHLFGGFALLSLLLVFYLVSRPYCQSQDTEATHDEFQPQENLSYQGLHSAYSFRKPSLPKSSLRTLSLQTLLLQRMGWLSLSVLIVQIFLGGWTSSNYAALVCTSLPLCEGDWLQAFNLSGAFTIFQHPLLMSGDSYEFGVLDYGSRMTIHLVHRFGAIITAVTLLFFAWRLVRFSSSRALSRAAWSLVGLVVLQISLGIANVVMHLPVILAVGHNLVAALLLLNIVFICTQLRLSYQPKNYQSKIIGQAANHIQMRMITKPSHITEQSKLSK